MHPSSLEKNLPAIRRAIIKQFLYVTLDLSYTVPLSVHLVITVTLVCLQTMRKPCRFAICWTGDWSLRIAILSKNRPWDWEREGEHVECRRCDLSNILLCSPSPRQDFCQEKMAVQMRCYWSLCQQMLNTLPALESPPWISYQLVSRWFKAI